MKISPSIQLFFVASLGAIATAAVDLLINGSSSGVLKLSEIVARQGIGGGAAAALSWTVFFSLGAASCAYFRPLTRRSAFALALGMTAVFSILTPPV